MRRFPIATLLAALILAWGAGPVQGQSASGSLAGRVMTDDGEPVAEAVVYARREGTGATRTTISDRRGRYRIEGLGPGRWAVMARLGNEAFSELQSVELRLQQTTTIDFSVGRGLTEHVTVRAETPLVDRRETAGKLTITGARADRLPLAGRVLTDLALLDSSVTRAAEGTFVGERGAVLSVNGQSGRSNSFLVDGMDNNDSTSGTTMNSFFSQQVIQEFVLLTHQYSAEFGGASGGLLNVVTRRGDNDHIGGAVFQGTSSNWNSTGDLASSLPDSGVSRDAVSRFQAGASFGGPLRKNRAFYFAAYEHQETDAVIPFTGITQDGAAGGLFVAPSENDFFFLRTDFNLGNANTLMVRVSGDDRVTRGVNVGGIRTPESGFSIEETDIQLAATLTSVISVGLLSETRVLAAISSFDQFANSDLPGATRPSGIFGGDVLNRQSRDEDKFELVQNLTWSKGAHVMKFGFDVTRSRTKLTASFNPNGSFTYDYDLQLNTGDCDDIVITQVPFAEADGSLFCIGDPNGIDDDGDGEIDEPGNIFSYPQIYTRIEGQPSITLDDTRIAVFAQDRVDVGQRWLLDYGLRYDVNTFVLPSTARVDSTIPNGGATRDSDNIAPRFGFTFTPKIDGKLIVRGGGGVFYDKLVLAFPAVAGITSGTTIGLLPIQGFAFEFTEENVAAGEQAPVVAPEPLLMRFSTGTELETPYTVQYNLGLERPIGRHSAVRANVIRTLGYNQPLMKDLNPVSGLFPALPNGFDLLIGNITECPVDQIDPDLDVGVPCHARDPTHGSISTIVTEGRSWYTGLELNWRGQWDDSWLRASYTLSKSEDMGFDPLKGGIALPPDSTDLSAEKGRSDNDRRHRFAFSGDGPLPWWGLRSSAVVQLSSGLPYNVTTGQDNNLDGIYTDRPAGIGRNEGEDSSMAAINAVRDQPVVLLAPITSVPQEPSFFQIDVRLYRPFYFSSQGRMSGEWFLQVFNLLDRQNIGLIEGRAISPNFGRAITLAGPPRTLEIGLRVGY